MKAWPVRAILIVQSILLLAHLLLFATWMHFGWLISLRAQKELLAVLLALSFTFIGACIFAFRTVNWAVSLFYKFAVVWLGVLNLLFLAALTAWIVDPVRLLLPAAMRGAFRVHLAEILLAAVIATALYALVNAKIIRVRRIKVALPGLPPAWKSRSALLLTDLHLGHVNGAAFARRIAHMARALNPDLILIAGDLYDGLADEPLSLVAPLLQLKPAHGMYFVTGNHEQFGHTSRYTDALRNTSIQVLDEREVDIDGLRLVGVSYELSTSPIALRSFLEGLHLDPAMPSILLNHVPHRLPIVADAGISLQLSGHTHSGQMFPFNFAARRAFGPFTYGLANLGSLQVYTSSGAGTWGPPMRLGSTPEIVVLTFI